jgi:hypothetical protein
LKDVQRREPLQAPDETAADERGCQQRQAIRISLAAGNVRGETSEDQKRVPNALRVAEQEL